MKTFSLEKILIFIFFSRQIETLFHRGDTWNGPTGSTCSHIQWNSSCVDVSTHFIFILNDVFHRAGWKAKCHQHKPFVWVSGIELAGIVQFGKCALVSVRDCCPWDQLSHSVSICFSFSCRIELWIPRSPSAKLPLEDNGDKL